MPFSPGALKMFILASRIQCHQDQLRNLHSSRL